MIANKKGWVVLLTKKPDNFATYPPRYFPRQYHYKADAERAAQTILENGGNTRIVTVAYYHESARIADSIC